MAYFLTVK